MYVHVDKKRPVRDGHKKRETANGSPKERASNQGLNKGQKEESENNPCDPKTDPDGTQKHIYTYILTLKT